MNNEELAREIEIAANSASAGAQGINVGLDFMRLVAERLALSPLPEDTTSEREDIIDEAIKNVRVRLNPFKGRLDEIIDSLQELKDEFDTDLEDENLSRDPADDN